MIYKKGFLKWAGGKRKLLPILLEKIGDVSGAYVEPFLGSGVVAMNVNSDKYILSDINKDLMNVYSILKKECIPFINECKKLFTEEYCTEDQFYKLRASFNKSTFSYERAILFIYLNRNSFNGLCRYNSKGEFNVPFGKYKTRHFPENEMLVFCKDSNKYTLVCSDFRELMSKSEKGDVIYCDPPYVPLSSTASFTSYSSGGFSEEDQKDLAFLAMTCRAKVIISNHDTDFTRELYRGADEIVEASVQRSVGASSITRKSVKELIVVYNK